MQFFKDGIHRTAQGLREFSGEEAIYSMKEQKKFLVGIQIVTLKSQSNG